MTDTEQRQRKTLEMALTMVPGAYELSDVNHPVGEHQETRKYVLRCKECEQEISVPLLQDRDDVWGSVVQIQIKKHREPVHKN